MSPRPQPTLGSGPLADIAAVVRAFSGLVIDASRREVLAGLVGHRIAELGLTDATDYLELVDSDAAERQTLIEGLTIGETYFARIPPQIRALQELVLPALLARGDRRIRIWSAGCSTGEEPYTLALLLAKLLPAGGLGWDVRIIGTDINSRALTLAREGRYGARSVSMLSDEDLTRYFIRDGDGWRVGEELRRFVEFRQHNLATEAPPEQRLDLVLCRNVLIYFDRPKMLEIIAAIHRTLLPGGWLLLGHSETLWRIYDEFSLVRHDDAFLYRRQPTAHVIVRRPPPLRRPLPIPPRTANPRDEIAEALNAGAYETAANLATAALEREPLAAELHYLHGLAMVELGQDAAALVALRRSAYLDPTFGFAQFLLGVVLGRLGHGAESARAYGAAAASLARREPDERVPELEGRRVQDLAAMCLQLASGAALSSPKTEVSSR